MSVACHRLVGDVRADFNAYLKDILAAFWGFKNGEGLLFRRHSAPEFRRNLSLNYTGQGTLS